jgi:hypothetical protein
MHPLSAQLQHTYICTVQHLAARILLPELTHALAAS